MNTFKTGDFVQVPQIVKKTREHIYIYALRDPLTNRVRYIGRSINPEQRLREHQCFGRRSFGLSGDNLYGWLKFLSQMGQMPRMMILERVNFRDGQDAEREWINYYSRMGAQLFNLRLLIAAA
jgi:hypothetical protein